APPPRGVRPELPERLEGVIVKAIEKDRHRRYQHAVDIATDLQRLKRDTGSTLRLIPDEPGVAPSFNRTWPVGGSATVTLGALIVISAYFLAHRRTTLTDKDTIVLADFINRTGDAVFDGTLRQGVAVQLEQSPFLSIVPDEQIQQTLQL